MDPLEQQLAQNPAPEPTLPTPEPEALPETEVPYDPSHRGHVVPMRTYSTDLANAIREKGGSVVRIAIAEDEKRRREYEDVSIKSKKNIALIVAGVLLIAGAIGVVIWGLNERKQASIVVPVETELPPSILSVEDAKTIDLTGLQVADILSSVHAEVRSAAVRPGTMKELLLAKKAGANLTRMPVAEFLALLGAHAPAEFLRSLSKEFMLGMYNYQKNNLYLVVQGTAHDFLLAGVLAWESNMLSDLAPLFSIDVTDPAIKGLTFTDAIIENRDARAIIGADKKPVLFYSFLDPDTIIITSDPRTLTEAILRF